MSILDKIKEANAQGKVYITRDPSEFVEQLPDGRSVIVLFSTGKYQDTNLKTSRYIGVQRSEPAVLLKPLKYIIRGGPKGGITKKGTLKAGEAIRIMGWPGFTDKKCCDLIALHGDNEPDYKAQDAYDDLMKRVVSCKEGTYVNLEEGVDYEYTGVAPLSAAKTKREVIAVRDIDYVDEMFCDGTLYAMTSLHLCTQFGETFLEYEGTRIMDDPVEGDDYI
jgi:hypothetical protein